MVAVCVCMADDPYSDHKLRDEWNEFKYYTEGVTTARMQRVDVDGTMYPCVKVFMRKSATEENVETVYEKAEEMDLVRWQREHEEEDEHIFVPAYAVE